MAYEWLTEAMRKTVRPAKPRLSRYRGKERPAPGCACLRCRKLKERIAAGQRDPMENAGAVQHGALEKGWSMGSDEENGDGRSGKLFGHLRPIDVADREQREAYGKPLPACYRHIIGPTPKCGSGDVRSAKIFLDKILAAIDEGGWSSSEFSRLYRLRDKWQARASGLNARFMVVGNKSGTPQAPERAHIKIRQQVQGILEIARGKKRQGK